MAFVPGHKHDLFLSYAHAEAAWVEVFRKALCAEFQVRAGEQVTVWQDSRDLRVGQKWASEIEEGIRNAAAFLAIVSPCYLNSPWCRQERAIVLEKKLEALKVDSFYRFLKIIKTPGPGNAHEEMLGVLQDIRFFNPANGYEHPESSAEFTAMIRAIVRHIRELLTFMSNKGQELYIAPGAIEMHKEREELKRELKDRGFTMQPEVLLGSEFGKGPILKAMDKVSHAIFVLGGVYDEFTAEQIEAAQELGKPVVFWIQPGTGQRDMLARIHDLPELPAGSEVLGGRSIREMIAQLLGKLKPRETIEPAARSSGISRVYVNYDTTLPEDSRIGARIADVVRDRNLEAVQSGRDGDHDRLMRISNGVLLLRAAHPNPDQWLQFNAMELALAGQIFEKKPDFAAKALLVADPARIQAQAAGVPVYPYAEPFAPETLDPFFGRLSRTRSTDARQ
jgi:hypothetical protein